MIAQRQSFGTLRASHFAARRGAANVVVALSAIGDRVAEAFAAQLIEWSEHAPTLRQIPCESDLQTLLTQLGSNGAIALAERSGGSEKVLLAMDHEALSQLASAFFGGGGADGESARTDSLTRIERSLASIVLDALARSLERSLAVFDFGSLSFVGLVEGVDSKIVGELSNQIRLELSGQAEGGAIYLGLPPTVVESFAQAHLVALTAATPIPEPAWRSSMQDRVRLTDVTVEAVLDGPTFTLGRLASLRPGQLIGLDAGPDCLIRLEYDGVPLYLARLGQANGALSVSIETALPAPRAKRELGAEGDHQRTSGMGLTMANGVDESAAQTAVAAKLSRGIGSVTDDAPGTLGAVLALPVTIKIVLGSSRLTVGRLMALEKNTIIHLNQRIGDPVELQVNGQTLARGELVVKEEDLRFGLKITEIVEAEREAQIADEAAE